MFYPSCTNKVLSGRTVRMTIFCGFLAGNAPKVLFDSPPPCVKRRVVVPKMVDRFDFPNHCSGVYQKIEKQHLSQRTSYRLGICPQSWFTLVTLVTDNDMTSKIWTASCEHRNPAEFYPLLSYRERVFPYRIKGNIQKGHPGHHKVPGIYCTLPEW